MALQRLARIAFTLGLLAIAYVSLVPFEELPSFGLWDKLEHALSYALVAMLGAVGWAGRGRAWAALGTGLLGLGVLLELLQSLVPGRVTDPGDAFANLVGTLIGFAVVASIGRVSGRVGRLGKGW